MQHIEINDPANCTIINFDGGLSSRLPEGAAGRTCEQCEQVTWRRTAVCMHCGFDRWARYRLAAASTVGAAGLALVFFHPLT